MMNRTAAPAAAFLLTATLALVACQHAPGVAERNAVPAAVQADSARAASRAGVAAANPLAVEAGLAVLRRGGSAVDAAVAMQAALGLVEPQSSGLGGGAFMVYLDGRTGKLTAFDGRETAPSGATPNMFIGEDGKPLSYADAVTSGRSTGAPGAIAMLGLAHERFGRLPWRDLFDTATRAADQGFIVP
ncbi:MAG: gamma-glutamyltransferase, partial [Steroidobacteraceae bacterium]|nr:gamma-glutamyltransferase [Steroidobacteraceae bacterium]